ncbi:MAG: hypothetical protein IJ119_15960 [Clostridia bacterium]|nr:hypothetical protein [Clostridia bacterium]
MKNFPILRVLGNVTRHDFQIANTPRGTLATRLCSWGRIRTDRSRDRTTTAAALLIVTTQDDAPLCVHGMDGARTHHSRQDRPSRCRRDDCRDGRPARQKGAQSRTEDAQPQPVRIAKNTSTHLSL